MINTFRSSSSILLLALLLWTSGCGGPPSLESAEAFSTTDALYTAITSRRTDLLEESEAELKKLKKDGKLSEEALDSLVVIIEQARTGNWQEAAEELDVFIRHQPPHRHVHGS